MRVRFDSGKWQSTCNEFIDCLYNETLLAEMGFLTGTHLVPSDLAYAEEMAFAATHLDLITNLVATEVNDCREYNVP